MSIFIAIEKVCRPSNENNQASIFAVGAEDHSHTRLHAAELSTGPRPECGTGLQSESKARSKLESKAVCGWKLKAVHERSREQNRNRNQDKERERNSEQD
ncbi:hypothetical protein EVAR_41221_1 [Eumeta japonica]|uniref:Uncharacterized protein n=1 Tax=Eumeta variegata TaxID=151549 RepID=A0A4C1W4U0_EUMVA|nr:hypothetical protein EVAR_41221_1 [Eumeta japonica]